MIGFLKTRTVGLADLLAKRKFGKAIELIREDLTARPNDPRLRLRLADTLILAGRPAAAVPLLMELADDFALAGGSARAIALLKRAQVLEPGQPDVEERLAYLISRQAFPGSDPWVRPKPAAFAFDMEEIPDDEIDMAPLGGGEVVPPVVLPPPVIPGAARGPDALAVPSPAGPAAPSPIAPTAAASPASISPPAASLRCGAPAARTDGGPPPPASSDRAGTAADGAPPPQPPPAMSLAQASVSAAGRLSGAGDDGPPPPGNEGATNERDLSLEEFADEVMALVEDVLEGRRKPESAEMRTVPVVNTPLFRDFSAEELTLVIRGLRLRAFDPGEIVVTEGEPGDSLFVVTTGAARTYVRDTAHRNAPVRMLQEGDFFGEVSLLENDERTATITAATRLELLEIDRPTLDDIAKTHPRIWDVIRRFYQERSGSDREVAARTGAGPETN